MSSDLNPTLFNYMKQTQRFLRDSKTELIDPGDIISYINRARREIAVRAQCIRVLTPIAGDIIAITVTEPGENYTDPIVTISAPDFPSGLAPYPLGAQATAVATQFGGTIAGINMTFGGSGYFEPQVTITDPTGTGAAATVSQMSYMNLLQTGQEVYPFSGVSLTQFPGVGSIHQVKSISIIYSNYRYSLPVYSMSVYQSMIRQYPFQYQYVPTFAAQYGQGANGSIYCYPLPSQTYQMEWDCLCLPSDLDSDNDVEALPMPWGDGVPYFAAHLAFLELQNLNTARAYYDLFEKQTNIYSTGARSGRTTNPYGRW